MTDIDFLASPHNLSDDDYLIWLKGHYHAVNRIGDHWVAVSKMLFTSAILRGRIDDRAGHTDRWCYHSRHEAERALAEWIAAGGDGEPQGWHRDPRTGRRRPNGNPLLEYFEP